PRRRWRDHRPPPPTAPLRASRPRDSDSSERSRRTLGRLRLRRGAPMLVGDRPPWPQIPLRRRADREHRERGITHRCGAHVLKSIGVDVTKAKRAWCKANAYVKAGQHEKAIRWFSRTIAILDGERPRRQRFEGVEVSYALGVLGVLLVLWVAAG